MLLKSFNNTNEESQGDISNEEQQSMISNLEGTLAELKADLKHYEGNSRLLQLYIRYKDQDYLFDDKDGNTRSVFIKNPRDIFDIIMLTIQEDDE